MKNQEKIDSAIKHKHEQLKRIYNYVEHNDPKTLRDIRKNASCDYRLVQYLVNNGLIQKQNKKYVLTKNSIPSIALARTYHYHIQLVNSLYKNYTKKPEKNKKAPISKTKTKTISVLWGLFKISW